MSQIGAKDLGNLTRTLSFGGLTSSPVVGVMVMDGADVVVPGRGDLSMVVVEGPGIITSRRLSLLRVGPVGGGMVAAAGGLSMGGGMVAASLNIFWICSFPRKQYATNCKNNIVFSNNKTSVLIQQ